MNFQLCHSEQRRNRPPPLSFRAKKIIRLRMIFTVEEPAYLTLTSALHLRETDKTNLAQNMEEPLRAACLEGNVLQPCAPMRHIGHRGLQAKTKDLLRTCRTL